MNYDINKKNNFKYKKFKNGSIDIDIERKFGRIFSKEIIKKYSGKIHNIIESVEKSEGIVLIYSQYIDNGCVPIALALEELGLRRYGGNNLFKDPTQKEFKVNGKIAKYVMITGDVKISPNNKSDLKAATSTDNINGENVKVIIISRTGTEGLDFKNIRQIHIMEPWYNINRIDQTIGRAVRNLSHCKLPYEKRNVEIYLYASRAPVGKEKEQTELIDLYMYRLAEKKGVSIGKIRRILKESSIDCLLNKNQLKFTQKEMNKKVLQITSTGITIDEFTLGDKDHSIICDFTKCDYECKPTNTPPTDINNITYNGNMITTNLEKILKRIRILFKEKYIYEKDDLVKRINHFKDYSKEQIHAALDLLINNEIEQIDDILGRKGNLKNIGKYYFFIPNELKDDKMTMYKMKVPPPFKKKSAVFNLKEKKWVKTSKSPTSILKKMYNTFKYINNPSKDKNTKWIDTALLCIDNLHYFHNIQIDLLKKLVFEHILDELSYDKKISLVKILYIDHAGDIMNGLIKIFPEENNNDLEQFLEYFESYFNKIKMEYTMSNGNNMIGYNILKPNKKVVESMIIFTTPDKNVSKFKQFFKEKNDNKS